MTAPDALTRPLGPPPTMDSLVTIGLDRPLNPQHLALLAAEAWGVFAGQSLAITLAAPRLPADGLATLIEGGCDLAMVEPVRLLDVTDAEVDSLGCVLRGNGGVLMREDRLSAFRDGDLLRITSPMCGSFADDLCRRILQGWAARQGIAVAGETILVEAAGTLPVENLLAGYDGVWVGVGTGEETLARQRGLAVRLITAEEGGIPPFCGLELVARGKRSREERIRHEAVAVAIGEASAQLRADPEAAVALWQRRGRNMDSETESFLRSIVQGLCAPIDRNPDRWQALRALV